MQALANQIDKHENEPYEDRPPNEFPFGHYQLALSTGIGLGRNPDPDSSTEGDEVIPEFDELEEFILGWRDDGLFPYDQGEDLENAVANLKGEDSTEPLFFEFKPLDTSVLCEIQPIDFVAGAPKDSEPNNGNGVATEGSPCNIDCKKLCIVCGQLKKSTCLDSDQPGGSDLVVQTPDRRRLNKARGVLLETLLYSKSCTQKWDAPPWFNEIVKLYTARRGLARLSSSSPMSSGASIRAPFPELVRQWGSEVPVTRTIGANPKQGGSNPAFARTGNKSALVDLGLPCDERDAKVYEDIPLSLRRYADDERTAQEAITYIERVNPVRTAWTYVTRVSSTNQRGLISYLRQVRGWDPDKDPNSSTVKW